MPEAVLAAEIQPGFPIVGIGSSAGGLEALETFFKAMPPDAGMAFVLVVHLDPSHASILHELLQKHTTMPVRPITDGMRVQPNHVYVIPPSKDLTILHGRLQLMEFTQPRRTNLPIDSFLRSLAQDQQRNAACIILSGTGTDGTLGAKAVKGEAGMVMSQDEESAKYEGMPHSVIATGLADYVLSPDKMPRALIQYMTHAFQKVDAGLGDEPPTSGALQKIFVILRSRTNHDFSLYKRNTICRRIERRMNVHQIENLSDYVRYLQESDREADILFKELLIGVTSFFRDPEAFEFLRAETLPALLANRPEDGTVRAWVPGCASGEEAYSVAITLQECMEQMGRHFRIQVFGTDIDEDAVNVARAGRYPENVLADVGSERIHRHFVKEDDGHYRVKKLVREMLVFAPQNVIRDPPFIKLDLLCCRNLLIYLGAELQKKLLPVFHYSLKPEGILFLGSSETIGQATDLFTAVSRKWKIYHRNPLSSTARVTPDFPPAPAWPPQGPDESKMVEHAEQISALQLVETILRQSDTPPCAIVNDHGDVVYIHGRTGRFLEPAEGRASANLLEMARPGLKADLAVALREAASHRQEVVRRGLRIRSNGSLLFLNLKVKPLLESSSVHGLMMVAFEEIPAPAKNDPSTPKQRSAKRQDRTAEEIEHDLLYTKENLQTTIEELETTNEELKSANEELQSTNEELQSTNEELETSKEELQSLNEESATVNAELQARIDELAKTNDDMKNLLDATEIATVFLDTELRVRRFKPRATDLIPLTGTDVDRPIRHLASTLIDVDLADFGKLVLRDLVLREVEVRSRKGQVYLMRVRPYRTTANVIDG
ncbi:MAG TPA: chemotaxis protein CheR, partial [Planctomycetaceae bacterium]|nr:chemotaxis protein CheR [Planctomycetaceae bacterium]